MTYPSGPEFVMGIPNDDAVKKAIRINQYAEDFKPALVAMEDKKNLLDKILNRPISEKENDFTTRARKKLGQVSSFFAGDSGDMKARIDNKNTLVNKLCDNSTTEGDLTTFIQKSIEQFSNPVGSERYAECLQGLMRAREALALQKRAAASKETQLATSTNPRP